MIKCSACGHAGAHAQVLAPGAGFSTHCPDCPTCQANERERARNTEQE